jgi:hypothetical protein
MPDLVTVDRNDVVVAKPGVGLSITYRKQGRVLVAVEPLRIDPSAEELTSLFEPGRPPLKRRCRSAGFTDLRSRLGFPPGPCV